MLRAEGASLELVQGQNRPAASGWRETLWAGPHSTPVSVVATGRREEREALEGAPWEACAMQERRKGGRAHRGAGWLGDQEAGETREPAGGEPRYSHFLVIIDPISENIDL